MTEPRAHREYEFGPFRLDAGNQRLRRDGQVVALKPKAFDMLTVLIEGSGRVMSKDELLGRVWPDTIIEDASLTQNIYELRKALGDTERPYHYIENVPTRGYRFIGEVVRIGEEKPVLAVLPFRLLGSSNECRHLELGFADAIAAALITLGGLTVRPTSSTTRYGSPRRDPFAAAQELGAVFIVDGSVQTSSDGLRVAVQLLDSRTRSVIWAETFDGRTQTLFTLQDAIAAKVADGCRPSIPSRAGGIVITRHPRTSDADQLYMKGRYNWSKATPDGLRRAVDFFRAAIEADPGYALAYVGIADAYTSLDWYGVLSTREANPQATAAAEHALEIDDSLPEAHASLAMARQYAWRWSDAESEYRTAIALNPDYAQAHQWYAIFLTYLGRFDEAVREIRRAESLDPVNLSIASQVALVLLCARRYDQAATQLKKALQLEPDFIEAIFYEGMLQELRGDYPAAIAIYRAMPQENLDFRSMLAHACGLSGRIDEARELIRQLVTGRSERHVALFWLAIAHVGAGDFDAALETLERACDDPDDSLLAVKVFPMLDPIRSSARFAAILERMGLQ